MQKIHIEQKLIQKLLPHQIKFMKLLQVPAVGMRSYIEQELVQNPLLTAEEEVHTDQAENPIADPIEDTLLSVIEQDRYPKQSLIRSSDKKLTRDNWTPVIASLHEELLEQLCFLNLNVREHTIGIHLVGSIDDDGYLRCELETIVNDLNTMYYLETNITEVLHLLRKVQMFDPPGIFARDLKECMLIQLNKVAQPNVITTLALQIITHYFEEFTKKHFDKIIKKLGIEDIDLFRQAVEYVIKLNPKPGSRNELSPKNKFLNPDFFISNCNGMISVELFHYQMPTLKINRQYMHLLEKCQKTSKKDKKTQEMVLFVKKKIESAKWFIDAIKQRNETLLNTMWSIVKFQYAFFEEEDEKKLKPMVLKQVAEDIKMDISTVSRIVNNKSIQTKFKIYPLKFFFSEGINTSLGDQVSNKAVKKTILNLIKNENKQKPYSDEELSTLLKEQGYPIARRTVAKYREQLQFPVARLRRGI